MCTFDVAYPCSHAKQSREKWPGIYHLCMRKLSHEIMEYCIQLFTDRSFILLIIVSSFIALVQSMIVMMALQAF